MVKKLFVILSIVSVCASVDVMAGMKSKVQYRKRQGGSVIGVTLSPVDTAIFTVLSAVQTALSPFTTTSAITTGKSGNSGADVTDAQAINQLKRDAGKPVAPSNGLEIDRLENVAESKNI